MFGQISINSNIAIFKGSTDSDVNKSKDLERFDERCNTSAG